MSQAATGSSNLYPPFYGLTGGIGSGKSTVAAHLAAKGAVVLDGDKVAHLVMAPGTEGLEAVVNAFGRDILGPDGAVARGRLAELVFSNRHMLKKLTAITHPLIAEYVSDEVRKIREGNPKPPLVVFEAAVLLESGWNVWCDQVWTVSVEPRLAVERMIQSGRLSHEQVTARMQFQFSNAEREQKSHQVIRNNGDLPSLLAQVDALWRSFLEKHPPPSSLAHS
ncbi:MAG: dephospho-CoA kinase [Deltaproteobacteria bacterium]|nr:dephospho-CoA kinase [Deltaproteobacteria bacterium]